MHANCSPPVSIVGKLKLKHLTYFRIPPLPPHHVPYPVVISRRDIYCIILKLTVGGPPPPSRTIVPSQGHTFFVFREGGGGFKSGKRNRSYQGRRFGWDHPGGCTQEQLRDVGGSDFLSSIFYSEYSFTFH